MTQLSPRQRDLVRAIGTYVDTHGRAPTVREIADLLGVTSTNSIMEHIERAEKKGALHRSFGTRALSVTAEGRVAAGLPPAETEHLRALLRRIEWAFASGCCGFCGGVKPHHRDGCELAAALRGAPPPAKEDT